MAQKKKHIGRKTPPTEEDHKRAYGGFKPEKAEPVSHDPGHHEAGIVKNILPTPKPPIKRKAKKAE